MSNAENLSRLAMALTADASLNLAAANTPAQFDKSKTLTTTEHLHASLGNLAYGLTGIATATTLTAANCGKMISINSAAPITVTLPLASTCPAGSTIHIENNGGFAVTILRQGADTINADQTYNSYSLLAGDSLTLVSAGTSVWIPNSGSGQLQHCGSFGGLKSSNGYQRMPGGFLMQWGNFLTNSSVDIAINFSLPFTSVYVLTIGSNVVGAPHYATFNSLGLSSFNVAGYSTGGARAALNGSFIAMGQG